MATECSLRRLETYARKQEVFAVVLKRDDETRCMGVLSRSLDQLEPVARRRIVRWLMERYVTDPSPDYAGAISPSLAPAPAPAICLHGPIAERLRHLGNPVVCPDCEQEVPRNPPLSPEESVRIAQERMGAGGGA